MANTMTLIQSVTVGSGGASSIDFTSIPSTYTDLCLVASVRGSAAVVSGALLMSINTVGTNRTARNVGGTGSVAYSSSTSDTEIAPLTANSATSSTFTSCQIYFPNYAGSTNKSFSIDSVNENNATSAQSSMRASLWSSTAAITGLSLSPDSGTFVQFSTAYLYGIKNS